MNKIKKIKIIEWGITRKCNYDCSYCNSTFERSKKKEEKSFEVLKNIFKYTDEKCHFLIGGPGEPFLANDFEKILKALVKKGYLITLLSNFSLPREKIINLLKIAKNHLVFLCASMHSEYVDLDKFINKIVYIRNEIKFPIFISVVATKYNISNINNIVKKINKAGIYCRVRANRRRKNEYTSKELEILNRVKFRDGKKNKFIGKKCLAGVNYLCVNTDSDAWRCWPTNGYIGNFLDNSIKLYSEAKECKYECCFARHQKYII